MSTILSELEIADVTGYKRAAAQVMELRRQGFFRARRAPVSGRVIVERSHFESVCGGERHTAANDPKVRELKSHARGARNPSVQKTKQIKVKESIVQSPQVRPYKIHRVA